MGLSPKIATALAAMAVAVHGANIYCDSLTYVGIDSQFDDWCQATCNQFTGSLPGFCPDTICQCPPPESPVPPGCTSPRTCPDGKYIANPGTTASDAWCDATCNSPSPVCPCTMCICSGPCDAGQELTTINFDDINADPPQLFGSYAGYDWDLLGILFPEAIHPVSGYFNGRTSEPNVGYTAFAAPLNMVATDGENFKVVSAALTGAWNDDLDVEVTAYDSGNNVIGTYNAVVNTGGPLIADFQLPSAARVVFTPTGGNNAGLPGSGSHLAIDDIVVCKAPTFAITDAKAAAPAPEAADGDATDASSEEAPRKGSPFAFARRPEPAAPVVERVEADEDDGGPASEEAEVDLDEVDDASAEVAEILDIEEDQGDGSSA